MDVKKLTIINVILAVLVIVLFVLHFSKQPSVVAKDVNTGIITSDGEISNNILDSNGAKIAWANGDSVGKYYDLAVKMQKSLVEQQAAAEKTLADMYGKYEKKLSALQKEAPILGNTELQMKQQELMQLEQTIMQEEQKLQGQLQQSAQMANLSYLEMTEEFMQEIGQRLGYDYVISYQLGGQVIYANPQHDITKLIIKELNTAYANLGEN
jgi:outer membrane protein